MEKVMTDFNEDIFTNKKVENYDNFDEAQRMVQKYHLKFNLENFLKNQDCFMGGSAAVLLVTPAQFVITECFVNKYGEPWFYEHGDTMEAIYSAIYDDGRRLNDESDIFWPKRVVADGNICMQLCNGCLAQYFISIPDVITSSQYNFLVALNDKIKSVYELHKDYFDANPMRFSNLFGDGTCINNMDGILEKIQNNIVDDLADASMNKETIVGSRIENTRTKGYVRSLKIQDK